MPFGIAHQEAVAQRGIAAGFFRFFQNDYTAAGFLRCAYRRHQTGAAAAQHHQIAFQLLRRMWFRLGDVHGIIDDSRGTDLRAFSAANALELVDFIAGAGKTNGVNRTFVITIVAGTAAGTNVICHRDTSFYVVFLL